MEDILSKDYKLITFNNSIKSNWKNFKHINGVETQILSKGIYFLYYGNQMVYIGSSRNLHSRIKQHSSKSSNKQWTDVICHELNDCSKTELLKFEKRLINYFKPFYNIKYE